MPLFSPKPDLNRARFLTATRVAVGPAGDPAEFDREFRRFEPLLPARAPLRVLDAGCGSGPWSVRWIERGAQVTGLDFDSDLLRLAFQRAGLDRARFRAVAADATRLPLRGDGFDVVTLNSILEHVPAWDRVVAEAARGMCASSFCRSGCGPLLAGGCSGWHWGRWRLSRRQQSSLFRSGRDQSVPAR